MDSLTATDLRTVGEFRLLARLGSGGMGQVFLGSSLAGRIVAVKVIHAELCRDPEFVRRFRHEVAAAQKVSGWYTAPVVAAGVDDNPPWLATAFVAGPSLDDVVSRHGPLPIAAVWRLAAGLAEALRAIHGIGLVHRDLKPANVLLALDGPRVIDFGISRAVTDTRLTATGAIIGTLGYMSPEQVQAQVTGPASDTFSLGSVLAYAASGASPFSVAAGTPAAAVMYRIVHGEPDLAAVPPQVRGLIEACLAKDPQARPDLGQVAAYSTATAESLGLSPAAFWPPELSGLIQAQQAALAAQIEALQLTPSSGVAGAWPRLPGAALAGPATAPGPGNGGTTANGQPVPWQQGAVRGTSRRALLIGAGVGGIAVLGGAAGWALSSRSAGGTPSSAGNVPTGEVAPTAESLPAGQSMQEYYGAGARRAQAWKIPTGNAIEANPGAGNGAVYVASTDNNFYAVSIATRRRAWSFQSGPVSAAPDVVGDVVCFATNEGHFYALRAADGGRVWDVDTSVPAVYKKTWAVDGGTVILAQGTAPAQAYEAATGTKRARFITQEPYLTALAADKGTCYALDESGILYAFRTATGAEIWHKQLLSSGDEPGTGLAVGAGGIYLGTVSGTIYSVAAASGQVRWTYHPGNGMDSGLVVTGGLLYVRDNQGSLQAIDAARGKKAWARATTPIGPYGVTVAGGRVYYSTALAIQALDAKTGTPVWAFTPSGAATGAAEFLSTPAVEGGLVFAGCNDDSLYAIQA
jgi:outer membrane protein assembly factor BamB